MTKVLQIKKGWVYIAPGGKHIRIEKKGTDSVIKLSTEPPIEGLRPCANVMYESLTSSNYDEITCVVLTGMEQMVPMVLRLLTRIIRTYML